MLKMKLTELIKKTHHLYRDAFDLLVEYKLLSKGEGAIVDKEKVMPYVEKVAFFNFTTQRDVPSPDDVEDLPENAKRIYFTKIAQRAQSLEEALAYSKKAVDFNDNQGGELLSQTFNIAKLYLYLDLLNKKQGTNPEQIKIATKRLIMEAQYKIWDAAGYDLQAMEKRFRKLTDNLSNTIIDELQSE